MRSLDLTFFVSHGLTVRTALPPGPEFDLDRARDSTRHEVEEAAFAAKNLGLSGHLGFQEKGVIINFRSDGNGFGSHGTAREGGWCCPLRLREGSGFGIRSDMCEIGV